MYEPSAMLQRARDLCQQGQYEAALPILHELIEDREGVLPKKLRRRSFSLASRQLLAFGRWEDAEELGRLGLRLFGESEPAYQCLGEALLHQGRRSEAIEALERAVALDPTSPAVSVLHFASQPAAGQSRQPKPWPPRQEMFSDPEALLRRYLFRQYPTKPFIRPETRFMTLGSCFAENLARRLNEAGYTTHQEALGEDVNSTYANRHLMEWVEKGPVNRVTATMQDMYGDAVRERMRAAFREADVFVMTLGVAPCFFDAAGDFVFAPPTTATGRAYLYSQEMRTTTVQENVDNIMAIMLSLKRLSDKKPRTILTVSPVPLAGSLEFYSAIPADCLSKSTLRVACNEVQKLNPNVLYWPSFEMVRWLGFDRAYGDDGNSRHVSPWLVDLIVNLFLERNRVR